MMDTFPHKSDFVNVNGIRLHSLDWGGDGPLLLFLAGRGCNSYIYDKFAPRFVDKFHAVALTRRGHGDSDHPETGYDIDTLTEDIRQFLDTLKIDQVILVGHSLAGVELARFSALYPERVLKLVFLDAAYDYTSSAYKAMLSKNPLVNWQSSGVNDDYYTVEDYITALKRALPGLAAIWGELMDEHILHEVKKTPEGKVVDRMTDAIDKALGDTVSSYAPEYSKIQAPVLSIYTHCNGLYYASADWMTEEQKARVIEFHNTVHYSWVRENMEQFQRQVPHAKIVEIPQGHHYCFIKKENLVFDEMRRFLPEE
jgi:pimeloyl-ACP methyl ester carboxylesterase